MSIYLTPNEVTRIASHATEQQTTFVQALTDMLADKHRDDGLNIDCLDAGIEQVYSDTDNVTEFGMNSYSAFKNDVRPQLDILLENVAWKDNYHYESVNDFVNVVMEIANERFLLDDNEPFARAYITSVADKYM